MAFPSDTREAASLVAEARRVLPVGAQSSLTGGATPRGDLVISTRALTHISRPSPDTIRVGAGVPLFDVQRALAADDRYYPPVPTYDGAFVGGTISTNAAGAATFKYGSTRRWVEAITVILADGSIVETRRGEVAATPDVRDGSGRAAVLEIAGTRRGQIRIPVPSYTMPRVAKLSAGYYAEPRMDLVDLFIGSEGTLGLIVEATLRVVPKPKRAVALITCASDAEAVSLTGALRAEAQRSWRAEGPLDVSAIEYMDYRALAAVPDEAYTRAGIARPTGTRAMLLVQVEVSAASGFSRKSAEDASVARLAEIFDSCGVATDPQIALPDDERGAARLFALREAVPASVNALVALAKARAHPDIEKTAGDLIVPFDRLGDSLALYRDRFERYGVDYAIWGHVSDGNLHPNVVPRSLEDVERGRQAILEMATAVIGMGGAPLAEHGVGRSALKQRLLRDLYGERGIEEMRAVKRALDPEWKFSSGVLFAP